MPLQRFRDPGDARRALWTRARVEPDLEPVPGRSGALRCTIVLRRPTRVAGRVVDGDGHPVRGATVLSIHAEDVGFGTGYLDCPSEIVCPDGRYVLGGLPPGTRVSLYATSLQPGRSPAEVVRTSADGVVRVPDLVLR